MQYQDFERDSDFYQSYDKQKIHPHSRRTPLQRIDTQDLIKWLYVATGILAFIFVTEMIIAGGEVNFGLAVALTLVGGLAFFTTIMFLIFRTVQMISSSLNLIRNKLQFSQTERR